MCNINQDEQAAERYRRSQDCPNTWDGESLQRGYIAACKAKNAAIEDLKKIKYHLENMVAWIDSADLNWSDNFLAAIRLAKESLQKYESARGGK